MEHRHLINQKGQSTVEFILAFSILIFFITFFITTAVNFAVGYLVHYATFKASRAYLTSDNSAPDHNAIVVNASGHAREIFQQFKVGSYGIKVGTLNFNDPGPTTPVYQFVGPHFTFEPPFQRFGMFKIPINLQFVSESFLGKEPSRGDCFCRLQTVMGHACDGATPSKSILEEITLEDNGC
jgi:hypothetical protein